MEQLCPEHGAQRSDPEVFIQINTEAEQSFSIAGAVLTMQSAPH